MRPMPFQKLRQLAIDGRVGDVKDMAGQLDIVESGTAQLHEPRNQRPGRVIGRAGKRPKAGDEDTELATHHNSSMICPAATAGVRRPSATSLSIFFTFARVEVS